MTKEDFLKSVITGIQHQKLAGDIMTYFEYQDKMFCPFCGKQMVSKLSDQKLVYLKCDCKKAIKINNQLNELIIIVENAQDAVSDIFKEINKEALKFYKELYINDIYPQIIKDIELNKDEILNSSFDD
jgi:DNA-directed RNA polymerase subunit M/transcription elongation factor TFIIS